MESGKAIDKKKHRVQSKHYQKEVNGDGANPATRTESYASSGDEPLVQLAVQAPRNGSGKKNRTYRPSGISEMSLDIPFPAPVNGNGHSLSKDIYRRIGKVFFESGLELDTVNSPSFRHMVCASHRNLETACTLPSCKDLEGWIFEEELKEMQQYAKKIRESWKQTGCSILLDGWQDAGGRTLVNVLVACPKGTIYLKSADISAYHRDIISENESTKERGMKSMVSFLKEVLKEVGAENVVQVITYTTSEWMGKVGKRFTEKHKKLFWTVSLSHCVELMLEEMYGINDTLALKGKAVALENSTLEGNIVPELVADHSFRNGEKASITLVHALEFLSESNVPSIAYVYHMMDVAKEKIKKEFKGKKSSYMPFWDTIDGIWNKYLHSPLHAAAAYLNPMLYHNKVYSRDEEVSDGLKSCLSSMPRSKDAKLVFDQVDCYGMLHSAFSSGKDDLLSARSPASWWHEYGWEVPELQQLAIRILSQTCDGAAKFNLKRSLAERFLTEGRSHKEQKRLADVLFVQYNLQLQNFVEHVDDHQLAEWMRAIREWIDSTKKKKGILVPIFKLEEQQHQSSGDQH